MDVVYKDILSVFISCPLVFLTLPDEGSSNGDTTLARRSTTGIVEQQGGRKEADVQSTDKKKETDKPGIPVNQAVKIAYMRSASVRKYLADVDSRKVRHILDINSNPRLHPIVYRLTYEEPLVVKVSD